MLRSDIQACIDILSDTPPSLKGIQGLIIDSNLYLKEIQEILNLATRKDPLQQRIALLDIKINKQKIRDQLSEFHQRLTGLLYQAKTTHKSFTVAYELLVRYSAGLSTEQESETATKLEQIIAINLLKKQNMEQQIQNAQQQLDLLNDVRNFKSFHINNTVTSFDAIHDQTLEPDTLYQELRTQLSKFTQHSTALFQIGKFGAIFILVMLISLLFNFNLSISGEGALGLLLQHESFRELFDVGFFMLVMLMIAAQLPVYAILTDHEKNLSARALYTYKAAFSLSSFAMLVFMLKWRQSIIEISEQYTLNPSTPLQYTSAVVDLQLPHPDSIWLVVIIPLYFFIYLANRYSKSKVNQLAELMRRVEQLHELEPKQTSKAR